jgi:hypothetical protein
VSTAEAVWCWAGDDLHVKSMPGLGPENSEPGGRRSQGDRKPASQISHKIFGAWLMKFTQLLTNNIAQWRWQLKSSCRPKSDECGARPLHLLSGVNAIQRM